MNLRIHIERLVLDGLPLGPADGPVVQMAVEAELTRLLMQGGLSPELTANTALPARAGAALPMQDGATPAEMGHGIARAVYGGIGR